MPIVRTLAAVSTAALLGVSTLSVAPASAGQALPKRTIAEARPADNQVSFNTFKLKGTVTEIQADGVTYLPYAGKVHIQKKACPKKSCKWKTVRKVKTNAKGKYFTKIQAPRTGRWKWRVKVKASNGYGTTKGETWTLFFK